VISSVVAARFRVQALPISGEAVVVCLAHLQLAVCAHLLCWARNNFLIQGIYAPRSNKGCRQGSLPHVAGCSAGLGLHLHRAPHCRRHSVRLQ
jgi:hypothetical protein